MKDISNLAIFSTIGITLLVSCYSTPISYDTAEIPYNSGSVRVGVGGQYYPGGYEEYDPWGGVRYHYSKDYNVRGDVQVGYGWKSIVEVGAMGGVAVGSYRYLQPSSHKNYDYRDFMRFLELQIDFYPYVKIGTPTDSARFSIKPYVGQGILWRKSPDSSMTIGTLTPKLDLLFGFGKPERLTLGLSLSATYTPIMALISLHYPRFTLSFMVGPFVGELNDQYTLGAFYFGIGKRF